MTARSQSTTPHALRWKRSRDDDPLDAVDRKASRARVLRAAAVMVLEGDAVIRWKDGKVDRLFSQVNPGWALPSRTQQQLADALDVAVAALRELVALKDIKEQSEYNLLYAQTTGNLDLGKQLDLEYRSRKQDAWRAARAALHQIGADHASD